MHAPTEFGNPVTIHRRAAIGSTIVELQSSTDGFRAKKGMMPYRVTYDTRTMAGMRLKWDEKFDELHEAQEYYDAQGGEPALLVDRDLYERCRDALLPIQV